MVFIIVNNILFDTSGEYAITSTSTVFILIIYISNISVMEK